MKNIFSTLTLLLCFLPITSYAQDSYSFGVLVNLKNEQTVNLLIQPQDYLTLQYGFENGYKITRVTLEENGDILSAQEALESKVLLIDALKPVPMSEWDNLISQGFPSAAVGKEIIFGNPVPEINSIETMDLGEVMDAKELTKMTTFASSVVTSKNPSLALKMGLAFDDQSFDSENKYLYTIEMIGAEDNYKLTSTNVIFDPSTLAVLLPPDELKAEAGNQQNILSWSSLGMGDHYFGFNIERSTDSLNWQILNTNPILLVTNSVNNDKMFYVDKEVENLTKYYYRVYSIDIFQNSSITSFVVSSTPQPKPTYFPLDQYPPYENAQGEVVVSWLFPQEWEDSIQYFNILKGFSREGDFELLNTSEISSAQREFTDNDPLPQNYYIIEIIDNNSKSFLSTSRLFQPKDSIPPSIPTGLVGEINDQGQLKISWNKNTELDMKGYRVYAGNLENDVISSITKAVVKDTNFYYSIDLNTLQEEMFVSISSVDNRDNESVLSSAVRVEIPDLIPPSPPSLINVEEFGSQLSIQWNYSSSDDVEYHILQRKIDKGDWRNLFEKKGAVSVDVLAQLAEFIDSTYLDGAKYSYRVIAADENDNISYSNVLTIGTNSPTIIGAIRNFNLVVRKIESNKTYYSVSDSIYNSSTSTGNTNGGSNTQQDQDYGSSSTSGGIKPNQSGNQQTTLSPVDIAGDQVKRAGRNCSVLVWDYDVQPGMRDFKIYRKLNNGKWRLYTTIPPYEFLEMYQTFYEPLFVVDLSELQNFQFLFIDYEVPLNRRVSYKVVASYETGPFSEISEEKSINIFK